MNRWLRQLTRAGILLFALALPSFAQSARWEIDSSHASAGFSVRHLAVSNVKGSFSKLTGTVLWNDQDITKSSVEATIDAATVDTRDAQRDAHLRSADFLDTARVPTITFRSTKVERAANGRLRVTGELTLRGVTRRVVLDVDGPAAPVKDPWGNIKSGFTATTTINRKDFGLTWNRLLESGGLVVGEEVNITIEAELVRKR
jgi:polyisoprenoid-binding protein YceI